MNNLTMKTLEAINDNDLMNISGGGIKNQINDFKHGLQYEYDQFKGHIKFYTERFSECPSMVMGSLSPHVLVLAIAGHEIYNGVKWSYTKIKKLTSK